MLIIFGISFVSDAKGHKKAIRSNLAKNLKKGQMGNSSVDLLSLLCEKSQRHK